MCSILLLPLVARCLETIDECIWCMLVFMYVVVIVLGSVKFVNNTTPSSSIKIHCLSILLFFITNAKLSFLRRNLKGCPEKLNPLTTRLLKMIQKWIITSVVYYVHTMVK